jgi:hypothetical protein
MRNTLFYSKHCPHSVELIRLMGSAQNEIADSLLYVSIDDAHIRNMLFVLKIEKVPTIVYNDKHYVGEKAFDLLKPEVPMMRSLQPPHTQLPPMNNETRLLPVNDGDSFTPLNFTDDSNRAEMISESKISDGDLEALLAKRNADIISPIKRD